MTFPLARGLLSIQQTPVIMQALLRDVDEAHARQSRDGDGWNVIEILCHLNDVEIVLGDRMKSSSADNPPAFPPLNPDELAQQNRYSEQSLAPTLAQWLDRRRELIAYLKGLTADDTDARSGLHSSLGRITVSEQVGLLGLHDVNHIEQIARALGLGERF